METLTNGSFPDKYKNVSTVVLYGENASRSVDPQLARHAAAIFDQINATELVMVEIVPDIYLAGLQRIASSIKYLSLYSYLGNFFKRPCDVLPNLEELHLELMDMAGMDLSSCSRLKKLWVRGYFAPTDVSVFANKTFHMCHWHVNYLDQQILSSAPFSLLCCESKSKRLTGHQLIKTDTSH